MTENRMSRAQIDAVWSAICQSLKDNVTKINSEPGKAHLHLDLGNIIGLIKVWAYDSERKNINKVGFELAMNTGSLTVWYEENLIRLPLWVDSVRDKDTGTLLYRFEGERIAIEELVDRVLERWLEKMKTGLFRQYI